MTCQHQPCTCEAAAGAERCAPSCGQTAGDGGCDCSHAACSAAPGDSRSVDGDAFDPHTVAESLKAPQTTTEYDGRP